jgi:hypothetical protein
VTSGGYNLIGKTDGGSGWVSSDLTGTVPRHSIRFWERSPTTAAQRGRWPSCPASRHCTFEGHGSRPGN